jgi:hypothetical protein
MNLYSLARKFPTEESALAHLIKGAAGRLASVAWIATMTNAGQIESTGNKTGKPRRVFQCAKCKLQFSANSGHAMFHDFPLCLLTKWFAAIALMADAKKGNIRLPAYNGMWE